MNKITCIIVFCVLSFGLVASEYNYEQRDSQDDRVADDSFGGYAYNSALDDIFNGYSYGRSRQDEAVGSIPGVPGVDYPVYAKAPETSFRCEDQEYPGYYADPEAECQAFHICQKGNRQDSFLCANGTLFNQQFLVCDWWNHVDCDRARDFYGINADIANAMEEATQRLRELAEQRAREAYARKANGYDYTPSNNGGHHDSETGDVIEARSQSKKYLPSN